MSKRRNLSTRSRDNLANHVRNGSAPIFSPKMVGCTIKFRPEVLAYLRENAMRRGKTIGGIIREKLEGGLEKPYIVSCSGSIKLGSKLTHFEVRDARHEWMILFWGDGKDQIGTLVSKILREFTSHNGFKNRADEKPGPTEIIA